MGKRVAGLLLGSALLAAARPGLPVLYLRHCARCHGADGSGRGPAGERLPGPRLVESRASGAPGDAEWSALVLEGKGAMPGFKAILGEKEVEGLLRALRPGPKARPRSAQ